MAVSEEILMRVLLREQLSLLAFIRAFVRDQDVADDVFQEVSVQAVHDREKIESEEHLVRWLHQVARHRSLNAVRDRRKDQRMLAPDVLEKIEADWGAPESSSSATQEALAALRQCMKRLTPFAQRLVNLRYVEGLAGAKLAEMINRSEGAVYMALSRVRRALGNCVREKINEGEHQ